MVRVCTFFVTAVYIMFISGQFFEFFSIVLRVGRKKVKVAYMRNARSLSSFARFVITMFVLKVIFTFIERF